MFWKTTILLLFLGSHIAFGAVEVFMEPKRILVTDTGSEQYVYPGEQANVPISGGKMTIDLADGDSRELSISTTHEVVFRMFATEVHLEANGHVKMRGVTEGGVPQLSIQWVGGGMGVPGKSFGRAAALELFVPTATPEAQEAAHSGDALMRPVGFPGVKKISNEEVPLAPPPADNPLASPPIGMKKVSPSGKLPDLPDPQPSPTPSPTPKKPVKKKLSPSPTPTPTPQPSPTPTATPEAGTKIYSPVQEKFTAKPSPPSSLAEPLTLPSPTQLKDRVRETEATPMFRPTPTPIPSPTPAPTPSPTPQPTPTPIPTPKLSPTPAPTPEKEIKDVSLEPISLVAPISGANAPTSHSGFKVSVQKDVPVAGEPVKVEQDQ